MKFSVRINGDLALVASEILQEAEGAVTHGVFASGRAYVTTVGGKFAARGLAPSLPTPSRPANFPRSGTSLQAAADKSAEKMASGWRCP
jgi:hypothetical protein